MIRHSKSFFISIVIHIILLVSILYAWDSYMSAEKVDCNTMKECDSVIVTLCNVNPKKIEKPKPKQKEKEKPLERPKAKKKKIEKVVPLKKEYTVIEKKIEPKPEEAVEEIKEEYEEVKKPLKEKPVEEKVVDNTIEQDEQKVLQKSQAELAQERKIKQESLTKEYIQVNTQEIAALLRDNLYYPRSARKRNITGQITVKFTLGLNSHVSDVVVVKSNSEILSRAAIKTIEDLSGKFPKPQSAITLRVPIGYKLN